MKIAIASGKGGTGKSTVATNLSYLLSKKYDNVALLDCDVEEPNCHIFLKPEFNYVEDSFVTVPQLDITKCVGCGKCANVCEYNAIAFAKGKVLIFDDLCHGCESCILVCPNNALTKTGRKVGVVESGIVGNLKFIQGKSRIGEAMSPPLIKAVKNLGDKIYSDSIQILDCPPGTSCPMITAIDGVDFVIMVTEPTPFGLHDLDLAVEVVKKIGLPFGVVINRSEVGNTLIEDWAKDKNINILAKIPNDRKVAECYSKGCLILEEMSEFQKYFEPLLEICKGGRKWW